MTNLTQLINELNLSFPKQQISLEYTKNNKTIELFYTNVKSKLYSIIDYSIDIYQPIILLDGFDLSVFLKNPLYRKVIHKYLFMLYFSAYNYIQVEHPDKIQDEDTKIYEKIVLEYYKTKNNSKKEENTTQEQNMFGNIFKMASNMINNMNENNNSSENGMVPLHLLD